MPFLTTNIRKVPGLSGSDQARYENLENSGPFFPIGGQAMFGSGSTGSVGTTGGFENGCVIVLGPETSDTGMASGGSGASGTSMSATQLNSCSPTVILPPSLPGDPGRPGSPPCPASSCCPVPPGLSGPSAGGGADAAGSGNFGPILRGKR